MVSITDLLNQANDIGVFSYVLPFLIIFSVVFAILQKSNILGSNVKGINAVVAFAIGMMALLNDFVSTFFATIFPRMGVFLAILLVALIFMGFFVDSSSWAGKWWIGFVVGLVVVFWSWENWASYNSYGIFDSYFFQNTELWGNIFWLAVFGGLIWLVYKTTGGSSGAKGHP
jgi:hypothetical protein